MCTLGGGGGGGVTILVQPSFCVKGSLFCKGTGQMTVYTKPLQILFLDGVDMLKMLRSTVAFY